MVDIISPHGSIAYANLKYSPQLIMTKGLIFYGYVPFDPKLNKYKIMKIIASTKLPLYFAENPLFVAYAKFFNLGYVLTLWSTD